MRFSTQHEGWFAISAAVAAGVLSYWNVRAAVVLTILALVVLALYEFAKRPGTPMRSLREQKAKNLRKLMRLFSGRSEITNDDVELHLGVSDATATNYLQELEDAGKVEQIGTTGRHVRYRKRGKR